MAKVAPGIAQLLARPDDARAIGPFRLIRQLGRGGFAPVWLASESYGGVELRTVAVKLFALDDVRSAPSRSGDTASRGMQRERILAEARALCQVEHPNVVRFFSIAADDEASVLGLAMEYVNGVAIDKRLSDKGKLDVAEALAIGSAIASALAAVHENGLVHCDVKPANVIDAMGVYKLIDFGIVAGAERRTARRRKRVAGEPRSRETPAPAAPSSAVTIVDDLPLEVTPPTRSRSQLFDSASIGSSGTLGYVDPACVLSGAPPTPGSDLYALGATLFECLTGKLPAIAAALRAGIGGFKGEVLDGREHAPRVRELEPDVPASLARIVDGLLEPDPSKRPRSAEAVAWEIDRVRRELGGRSRPLPPEERGPFRGLGRFEGEDRDVYFGRGSEIAAGLEMVRRRGLVALIGPSGSGKSSLARAGLLPAIADGELGGWPKEWDSAVAQPGEDPRASIAAALEPLVGEVRDVEPEALVVLLADAAAESGRGIVLLVDQLEELVTVSTGPGRAWAVSFLARLGSQAVPGVRALVAARRDLLDELLALEELGRILTRGTLLVTPLSDIAWEDVLDQALDAYGYRLEDKAMRHVLLEQLRGTSSAMPLVQFALARLWEKRDPGSKTIPRAALEAIGGIGGALEAHADATLAALGEGAHDAARGVLLALTTAQGTRATRTLGELSSKVPGDRTPSVVKALLDARLLTSEAEGLTLAHEALLTRWGALRRWVADAREDRLRVEEIEREASLWVAEQRPPERLLKKRRLRAAEDLANRTGGAALGETARAFIRAGRAAERRGTLFALSPLGLVVLAALVFAAVRWDASRLKTSWCVTTVERMHVPECVASASEDEAARRSVTHRLSTIGGRVVRLEHLNGEGVPKNDDDGYAVADYQYDAAGVVREITYRDRLGNVKLRKLFTEGARRVERRDSSNVPVPLAGTDIISGERRTSDVTVVRYEYDDRGFVRSERFFSTFEKPRGDYQGAFGYSYERDARGLWTRGDVLGPDGKPTPAENGFARATRKYDERGDVVEAATFDVTGAPTLEKDGMHMGRFTYDAHGNLLERAYFGVTGKPITSASGFARWTTKYDDRGDAIEETFFDVNGERVAPVKYGYASWTTTYDARGNPLEQRLFGKDGHAVVAPGGAAGIRMHYDAKDQPTTLEWLGLDGQPTSAGAAARRYRRFDDRGNVVEEAHFGVDGKPVKVAGCARTTRRYDARDDLLEEQCFDVEGKPGKGDEGWATAVYSYDDAGQKTEVAYFAADGSPVQLQNGYARIKYIWEGGNQTQALYFGADGKPALGAGGFFLEVTEWNDRGKPTSHAYYGTDSSTPAIHWGYFKQMLEYDPTSGRLVAERYLGTDGKPTLAGSLDGKSLYSNGFAKRTLKYDERGNLVEERFFGVDDAPLTIRDRLYAWRAWKYDAHNDKIEEAYFAYNDQPTRNSDQGVAGWHAEYDDEAREVRREYFDVDGKPAYVKDAGYAAYAVKYDVHGKETERAYFAPGGAPAAAKVEEGTYARTTASYDDYGHGTERAYFDPEGKPVAAGGYARHTTKYDGAGHAIEEAFFGNDDRPVATKRGYARVVRKVDDRGDVLEEAYFGEDGAPTNDLRGVGVERASFDDRGMEVARSFFDKDDKPIVPQDPGYWRATKTYDDAGREVERAYFGEGGAPAKGPDGAARVTTEYQGDSPADVRYFDEKGAPAPVKKGYARESSKWDSAGRKIGYALYDAQGAPFVGEDGWASWTASFDPAGHETEHRYFDAKHALSTTKAGHARTTTRYDERGRAVEQWWFDAHDRPVAVRGAARVTMHYDEWNHLVDRAWFGADGKPVAIGGVARERSLYDGQGRLVETSYYGEDGGLTLKGEWAKRTYEYDAAGNVTVTQYYGAGGKPIVIGEGYARNEEDFDERNKEVEARYFDARGELAPKKNGVIIARYEYDARGNVIKRTFLGKHRELVTSEEGIAGWTSEFDDRGNVVKERLFGVDGKPAVVKGEGWAGFDAKYDDFGHRVDVQYLGVDGQPVMLVDEGYSRAAVEYDPLGREIEDRFYGTDGKLVARKDGIAEWRIAYDPAGHETERRYFGPDEKPAKLADGFARYVIAYDSAGRMARAAFFDESDAPVVNRKQGCATITWTYAADGESKRQCFDAAGHKTQ